MEEKGKKNPGIEPGKLLVKAANNFEAGRIEAALKDEGIPVFFKYKEAGIFGFGSTAQASLKDYGVDMYVPEEFFDRARDVLIGIGALNEEGEHTPLTDLSGYSEEEDKDWEFSEEEYGETIKTAKKLFLPAWAKRFLNVVLFLVVAIIVLYVVFVAVLNLRDLFVNLMKMSI